jgi:hypothetical protein
MSCRDKMYAKTQKYELRAMLDVLKSKNIAERASVLQLSIRERTMPIQALDPMIMKHVDRVVIKCMHAHKHKYELRASVDE